MTGSNRRNIQFYIDKLRQIMKSRRGTTLVEMVVTFALISLFAAGTCHTIASAMKVYYKIRALNNVRQTADTLMDKITGVVEGAQVGVQYKLNTGEEEANNDTLIVSGSKIELYDRTGSHIHITSENGEILIHYYPVGNEDSPSDEKYDAVDWKYGKDMYMGFEVSRLNFSRAGADYPANVIKVELDLTGTGYGTFTTTRYVECYNFITPQDLDKIGGGEGTDPSEPTDPGGGTDPGEGTDPSGPPDPSGDKDQEGDKEEEKDGIIIIDKNDNISFTLNGENYQNIRKEAENAQWVNGVPPIITIPMGIYEEGGVYYLFPDDLPLQKQEFKDTLSQLWNTYEAQKLCIKLDAERLFTEADISDTDSANSWKNGAPRCGSIYFYKGEYYVCREPAWVTAQTNPVGADGWVKVTELVTKLTE